MHEDSLILTKLTPPNPLKEPFPASKERLFGMLDQADSYKIVLLTAPSGFGKTTLLASWLKTREVASSWLALDAGDNDPRQFFSYFLRMGNDLLEKPIESDDYKRTFASLRQVSSTLVRESVLTALVNSLAQLDHHVYFLFDNIEVLTAKKVLDIIIWFITYLPNNVHLIFSGTSDAVLPVWSLKAKQELLQINYEHFMSTETEIHQLLAECAVNAPVDLGGWIYRKTKGWPLAVGLLMNHLVSTGETNGYGVNTKELEDAVQPDLRTYFHDRVFDPLDEYVKEILLKVVIPPLLCKDLYDKTIPKTTVSIVRRKPMSFEEFVSLNLYLFPVEEKAGWYAFLPQFRNIMCGESRQKDDKTFQRTVNATIEWFSKNSFHEEAVELAMENHLYKQAAKKLDAGLADLLDDGHFDLVLNTLNRLPQSSIDAYPALIILDAVMGVFRTGKVDEIERKIGKIQRKWRSFLRFSMDAPTITRILEHLMALYHGDPSGIRNLLNDIPETQGYLKDMFTLLWVRLSFLSQGEIDSHVRHMQMLIAKTGVRKGDSLSVESLCLLGSLHVEQLLIEQAEAMFNEAIEQGVDEHDTPLASAGQGYIGLGRVSFLKNNLDEAQTLTHFGIKLSQNFSAATEMQGVMNLIDIAMAKKSTTVATRELAHLRFIVGKFGMTEVDDRVTAVYEAKIALLDGNVRAAKEWADTVSPERLELFSADRDDMYYIREIEASQSIAVRFAAGEYQKALDAVGIVRKAAGERGRIRTVSQMNAWQSAILGAQGNLSEAAECLESVLPAIDRERIPNCLVSQIDPLKPVLIHITATGKTYREARDLLCCFFPEDPSLVANGIVSASLFTERETEVLKLMAQGRQNKEIADALCVSVRTVKWHVGNILEKLKASTRTEAVILAHQRGLV